MQKKKQGFIMGAFLLIAAMIVVKIIGALFKIPLTALLGGEGMGYFSTAYSLFNPIAAVSITGLPLAVARVVSENKARGNYKNIKKIFKISFWFFLVVGVLGTGLIFAFSRVFTDMVENPAARLSVMAIAPAMLFSCLMSSFRGYYEGLSDMKPTAFSQVIEAVFKLLCGYSFSAFSLNYGISQFERGGKVYGVLAETLAEARMISLPVAAAGAILGVSISTVFGFIYLVLRHKIKGDGIEEEVILLSLPESKTSKLLTSLIKIAVPIAIGSLVTNLTTLIDVSSLMQRIARAIETAPDVLLDIYQGLIPETVLISGNLPNYLYGIYSSMAITIYNLVPAITSSIGISALPMITAAATSGQREEISEKIASVLRITALISIPAGLGLSVLANPILKLLFSSRPMETEIASPLLTLMGITVIFTALTIPLYNVLQGLGKPYIPVVLMVLGGGLKLIVNFMLVSIPRINILGAPIGSLCCYGFIFLASLIVLRRYLKAEIDLFKTFIKPLFSAIICALSALVSYNLLKLGLGSGRLELAFSLLISIAIAVLIYAILLIITKTIDKNDILLLPFGKNILKTLEKWKLV